VIASPWHPCERDASAYIRSHQECKGGTFRPAPLRETYAPFLVQTPPRPPAPRVTSPVGASARAGTRTVHLTAPFHPDAQLGYVTAKMNRLLGREANVAAMVEKAHQVGLANIAPATSRGAGREPGASSYTRTRLSHCPFHVFQRILHPRVLI